MSWFNRIRNTTSRLASSAVSGIRQGASNIIPESIQRIITNFGNWLTGRVGPEQIPQVLNEIIEHIRTNYPPRQSFEIRESNSTLRNFTRVYTIDGIEGFDTRSFLDGAREIITSILRNNRRTKVKLILKCIMEKGVIPEEIEIQEFAFHSNIEINLEGTDEDDIYFVMTERILKKIATLLRRASGWRLRGILSV